MPAAVPTATASVGETSKPDHREHREPDAEEDGREDRAAAEPAAEADRVPERLGRDEDEQDLGRVLGHEGGQRVLAGEKDVLRVGPERLRDQGEQAHGETAGEEQRRHPDPRLGSERAPAEARTTSQRTAVMIPMAMARSRSRTLVPS